MHARGAIYLYPADVREGYHRGRLRLVYEANPVGFIIEQAGGRASTGREPLLEMTPASLHERTALVFGARAEVERIEQYHNEDNHLQFDAPLIRTMCELSRDLVGSRITPSTHFTA